MVYSSLYFKRMSSLLFYGEEVLWWRTCLRDMDMDMDMDLDNDLQSEPA